ncbi:hypothetical protein BELL_0065g00170 [Botrytis elliptica]|uniref:Uncharacterized protein n=1 Tax=Botrytis elliptica TaxID=278938 RepID=A0A4Z1JX23_9HELO|nr:hypothetical protein BELL_0065g00170 [Botrytis elliptica]
MKTNQTIRTSKAKALDEKSKEIKRLVVKASKLEVMKNEQESALSGIKKENDETKDEISKQRAEISALQKAKANGWVEEKSN